MAMPDIKSNDKWPNIDGYVDLTDKDGHPVYIFKVQVKNLSKYAAKRRLFKFTKKESRQKFLDYCERSRDLPILLIGVDLAGQRAYWRHIDRNYLKGLGKDEYIAFPEGNLIARDETDFINSWRDIAQTEISRKEITEAYQPEDLKRITDTATPILGREDHRFRDIHLFLDKLNNLLDNEYNVIKKVFYLDCWKVGFACFDYTELSVGYILYPIPFNKNDVLIKGVGQELFKDFVAQGRGYKLQAQNLIKDDPLSEIEDIVRGKLQLLFQHKLLFNGCSEYLAREYVIAFVDTYFEQLDLAPNQESYGLKDIEYGFRVYLPFWLSEASLLLKHTNRNNFNERIQQGRTSFFDPEWIDELDEDERRSIRTEVLAKIKKGDEPPSLPVHAAKLSPRVFSEYLHFLKDRQIKEVERLYRLKDTEDSTSLYQAYTPETMVLNIQLFMTHFLGTYKQFIENNFPLLSEDVSYTTKNERLLFVYDMSSQLLTPTYNLYKLSKASESIEDIIEVISKQQLGGGPTQLKQEYTYQGKVYELQLVEGGSMSFMYSQTPMFDFIYRSLEARFSMASLPGLRELE